ncbi:MAG: hypothetical protein AMXMBFR59_01920 [Rhodanobacteraceae bacterium]
MSLAKLTATGLAPIDPLSVDFGERVNLVTGDNGLGKSLILDLAFWQLTNSWPGQEPLRPANSAVVTSVVAGESSSGVMRTASYSPSEQRWVWSKERPPMSALVIYARANGGFSVWDPARNYYRDSLDPEVGEAPRAYLMSQSEVWHGLPGPRDGQSLCNGLIRDWVSWQRERRPEFDVLARLLQSLSPSPDEPLVAGEPRRLSPDDVRDYPTLRTSYAEIPAHLCSEAVKRVLGLAYLIAWTWTEHQNAARLRGWSEPFRRLVVLVDEIEAHLHPRWQRTILPSLLAAIRGLNPDSRVQLIGVTHAPLLLASMEPEFDEERDRLFVIDLVRDDGQVQVRLQATPFERKGDATAWLTSDVFDLPAAVSLPAQLAREKAAKIMAPQARPTIEDYQSVDRELRAVSAPSDVFLLRWRHFGEKRGFVAE